MRSVLKDIMHSTVSDECTLASTGPTLSYQLTTAFQPLATIFGSQEGGDGVFLKPDFGTGTIGTATTAGYSYEVVGAVTIEDANNVVLDLSIAVDGAPLQFIASVVGKGAGKPFTIDIGGLIRSAVSNSVITLVMKADKVADVDIINSVLRVDIKPTNNP